LSVITREGGEENLALQAARQYDLEIGSERMTESFPHEFLFYDPDRLDAEPAGICIQCLEESEVAAVSVGAGQLPRVGRLIATACLQPDCPPLHLFAFENTPGASQQLFATIKREVAQRGGGGNGRQIIPHAAIPDRACTRKLDGEKVVVSIERFGEIVLEESARPIFGEMMGSPSPPLPYLRYIPSEAVLLGEMRKFWLVNGTHTALGVLCAKFNRPLLLDGLSDERISLILRELHGEWVQILHSIARGRGQDADVFTDRELSVHAARMFDRLHDVPNFSVREVLRELTMLGDPDQSGGALKRLLQKVDDRLAMAVREAGDQDSIPVPASGWITATGVGTVRWYADRYME
jgi:hypothetical protein